MDFMIYGISKLPKYGESIFGSSYEFVPGGKGLNQALSFKTKK